MSGELNIDFKALQEKYADQSQFPRMIGTMGGWDYIILAKRPEVNLQLGIKPLIMIGTNQCQIGFRLRSAPIPGTVGLNMDVPLLPGADGDPQKATQGYPSTGWAFPWEKVSEERASLVRFFTYQRQASQIKHLFKDMKQHRFYGKVTSFLMEQVDGMQLQVTPDEIHEWFQAIFSESVIKVAMHHDPSLNAQNLLDESAQQHAESKALEAIGAEPDPEADPDYQPITTDDPLSTAEQMLGDVNPFKVISGGADEDDDNEIVHDNDTGGDDD